MRWVESSLGMVQDLTNLDLRKQIKLRPKPCLIDLLFLSLTEVLILLGSIPVSTKYVALPCPKMQPRIPD